MMINKKKLSVLVTIAIVVIYILLHFTTVRYGDTKIPVFAFYPIEEILSGGFIRGSVIGSHVLETEYGNIQLRNNCRISIQRHSVNVIEDVYFKMKKATHALEVEGIKLPNIVSIVFDYNNEKIDLFSFDDQEVHISGVTLLVDSIIPVNSTNILSKSFTGYNVGFTGSHLPEKIILSDSTEISFVKQKDIWSLSINNKQDEWSFKIFDEGKDYFHILFPGEKEYRKYKSITFGKNWGQFIEGELFEEK